jgi:hypothetical protein
MKKGELLGKELSNLYAIAKQVNHHFDESDIRFLSEKSQKILEKYIQFSSANEEQASGALRDLHVNPGNTTDSIVHEITENLHEIATHRGYSKEVRELGYVMSLNRLIGYHAANIENVQHMVSAVYDDSKNHESG